MYKNMKIEINEQQPLDEIVGEIERFGYLHGQKDIGETKMIICFDQGFFIHLDCVGYEQFRTTTLAELKEQPNEAS